MDDCPHRAGSCGVSWCDGGPLAAPGTSSLTERRIDQILRHEAEHVEAHKDAALRDGTVITHKNQRSYVFSIRLSESERTALEQAAQLASVAPSSLARSWIAERLASGATPTDVQGVANTLETLAGQLRTLGTGVDRGHIAP